MKKSKVRQLVSCKIRKKLNPIPWDKFFNCPNYVEKDIIS